MGTLQQVGHLPGCCCWGLEGMACNSKEEAWHWPRPASNLTWKYSIVYRIHFVRCIEKLVWRVWVLVPACAWSGTQKEVRVLRETRKEQMPENWAFREEMFSAQSLLLRFKIIEIGSLWRPVCFNQVPEREKGNRSLNKVTLEME